MTCAVVRASLCVGEKMHFRSELLNFDKIRVTLVSPLNLGSERAYTTIDLTVPAKRFL